jgi:hypothetical protein
MDPRAVSYLGVTTARHSLTKFGIRQADRFSHIYIIGATGVGKSRLIESLVLQDLAAGRGFALIDPHGDLAERVHAHAHNRADAIYLDAAEVSQPFGYNPLKRVRHDKIPLAASGLLDALRKLWPDAWGVRMEHVLRNALYALLEQPSATLPDILRMFWDEEYTAHIAARLRNPVVRTYWTREFPDYPPRLRAEVIAPIQNKLGAILTDPRLYRILVSPPTPISFRQIMDQGGVLIANLAKGRLGDDSSSVMGGLLASTLSLAALSRAEEPTETRRPFHIYIDEFQSFTTLAFANMLPELRKYGVSMTLAHQHSFQLEPQVRHAVWGNAGTSITFRTGAEDAELLAKQFQPQAGALDIIRLPNRHFYIRLMIDGEPSIPFSARTLAIA